MEALGLVPCIALPVLALLAITGFVNWALGPLIAATRQTPTPTRFMLSDLLWLMVQLQLAMGLVVWAVPADLPTSTRVGAMVFLCVPVVGFWYGCLHGVDQAGIQQPLRRAMAFVVLLPGTTLAVVALPLLTMAWLALLGDERRAPAEFGLVTVQLAVAAAASVSLRWLATWIVARSTSRVV